MPPMNKKAFILIFMMISGAIYADSLILTNELNGEYIGKKLLFFIDKTNAMTLDEVRKKDFFPSGKDEPNFGYNSHTYWLKFHAENKETRKIAYFLEMSYSLVDRVDLFIPQEDGTYKKKSLGLFQPFKKREILYRNILFSLEQRPSSSDWYYIRVATETSKTFPLQVWSNNHFIEKILREELFLGVFYGIMLVMLVYNLFLLLSVRDINYFYYIFWLINATMVQMSLNGYSFEYLWPNSNWWSKQNTPFFMSMGGFFGIQFARVFLDTPHRLKKTDKYLLFLMFVSGISVIVSLVAPYPPAIRLGTVLWIIIPVSMIITTILSLQGGYKPARYFFIGWIFAFLGTGIFAAKSLGLLPNSFLTKWGMQIGVALEVTLLSLGLGDRINQLKKDKELAQKVLLETKNNMLESFARFVPRQFLKFLERESVEDVRLGDAASYEMTVLFSDIRKFTDMSENMTPDESFFFLNSLFKRMEPIIQENNGFVDKYIGDAVMALFPESPEDAIKASLEIKEKLVAYNEHRSNSGYIPIDIGLGIHSGNLILGTVGSSRRIDTTVIGDTVNLASRIESLTKYYKVPVILSDTVYEKIPDKEKYCLREIDRVKVKGKQKIVILYELFNSDPEELREKKMSQKPDFEKALDLYRNGGFSGALDIFQRLYEENPEDKILILFLERCRYLINHPPSDRWQGVARMGRK